MKLFHLNTARPAVQSLLIAALTGALAACGGDKQADDSNIPEGITAENVPMMPDRTATPLPTGEIHTRASVLNLIDLTAVDWAELREEGLFVGVIKSAYENDSNPIIEACLRVQKSTGQESLTAYLLDSSVAPVNWKEGDPGLVYKMDMPLSFGLNKEE